jgi:hypothetical protein
VPLTCTVKSNKGKIELTWNTAKQLISKPDKFIQDVKTFGKELVRASQVPNANFVKAKKLIEQEELT